MLRLKTFAVLILMVGFTCGAFGQAAKKQVNGPDVERIPGKVVQTFTERGTQGYDVDEYFENQRALFQELISQQPALSERTTVSVELSQADRLDLDDAECAECGKNKKLRVGVAKNINMQVDFTNMSGLTSLKAPRVESHGVMQAANDGGFVWGTAIHAVDGSAVRLHFTDFSLPPGVELFVFNEDGQAFGPYTNKGPLGTGEFWSNTVFGDMAFVQLRYSGPISREDLHDIGFVIQEVGHVGAKFLMPFFQGYENIQHKSFCSFNASCVENAACSNVPGAIASGADAMALIFFQSGAYLYIFSGGLLADTDASSEIPLFLTANHCISKGREANSVEAYFQFTTNCNGSCFDPRGTSTPSTNGASILSSSRTSDYTLLQLSQNAPSGSAFLGWTSSPVANTNGANLYRLSHPGGAPQAYSEHSVDTNTGACTSWPRGNWIYSKDTYGATEGGSSGSPVLNGSGQVVGQLSGACGFNVNDPCGSDSNATVDGALAAYYSNVSQYLDPQGGGNPGGGTDMHVSDISLSVKNQGPNKLARATVTIVDENNDPVSGATVTGDFTGGLTGSGISGTTDSSGQVTLQTGAQSPNGNSFTFCVTSVSGSLNYDSGANSETCDSLNY